jgi:hypothetical protein
VETNVWKIKTKYYNADVQFISLELDLKSLTAGQSVADLV